MLFSGGDPCGNAWCFSISTTDGISFTVRREALDFGVVTIILPSTQQSPKHRSDAVGRMALAPGLSIRTTAKPGEIPSWTDAWEGGAQNGESMDASSSPC